MRTFTAGQADIMAGRAKGIVAHLLALHHPDGIIRMSSLPAAWVDGGGVSWIGGGGVLSFGAPEQAAGLSGGGMTVTWSGADEALVATARDGKVAGRLLERWLAFINDSGAQVGAHVRLFAGICEQPAVIPDPAGPRIELRVEARALRLNRERAIHYTPEMQKRYFAGDSGFDFVAGLSDAELRL